MQIHEESISPAPKCRPWNKGKLIGAKPPLRSKHVWSIRTKLQIEGYVRDLALFNLAIDSKLRGCDVVALKVEDVAPNGYAVVRATVRQKKTGRPVRFELSEQTRQAINGVAYEPLRPKIEATFDALHHGLGDSDLLFAIGARAFGVEDDPNLVVDEVVRIIGEERIDTFPGNPRRLRIGQ